MDCSAALTICTLCLLLLPACPGDDGEAGDVTVGDTSSGSTTSASPTETSSEPTQTGSDTESDTTQTSPPDTDTAADTTETDTADTDTDTDTDTGSGIEGCECIEDQQVFDSPEIPAAPTCGEALCPSVSGSCVGDCFDTPFVLDDPATLVCALTALRDRTPGVVRWSYSDNIGQNDDAGYILIEADGAAVRRNWGWTDLVYDASDAVLGELRPVAEYDACLAEPDDLTRFDCLRARLVNPSAVCDEGWSYFKL